MPTCRPIGITPRLLAKICSKVGVRAYGVRVDSDVSGLIAEIRKSGPMSLRKLESVTGRPYVSLHAAINSPAGRQHIRKVPGTSAPALYELIK